MIYIVGLGPGNREYILPKAIKVMQSCDLVVGFKRAIDSLDFIDKTTKCINTLKELDKYLCIDDKDIAIVASGDPTFYGISNYVKNKTEFKVEIIPGISSFQYLTCKLGLPWNNAYVGSLHGRCDDFINVTKKYDISIWLTDNKNSPSYLCKLLEENEIECKVVIGENLSYDDELIKIGLPSEFMHEKHSTLSVFIIERSITV